MTSARPFDSALSVENRWNTRTGSSVLRTVTADPSRMRLRPAGNRREHDLGRRDREVGPMVLADAERVEAELVGEHRLLDDVAEHAGLRLERAVRRERDVAEGIEAEFESFCHSPSSLSRGTARCRPSPIAPARLDDRPGR